WSPTGGTAATCRCRRLAQRSSAATSFGSLSHDQARQQVGVRAAWQARILPARRALAAGSRQAIGAEAIPAVVQQDYARRTNLGLDSGLDRRGRPYRSDGSGGAMVRPAGCRGYRGDRGAVGAVATARDGACHCHGQRLWVGRCAARPGRARAADRGDRQGYRGDWRAACVRRGGGGRHAGGRGAAWACRVVARPGADAVASVLTVARLAARAPAQVSAAPRYWSKLGRSPSISAARPSEAAGCTSSISEPIAAGSLGSDEVISSQPATWLISASMASQKIAGQIGCSARPPPTRPITSEVTIAPVVASATGPATCAESAEDRRNII